MPGSMRDQRIEAFSDDGGFYRLKGRIWKVKAAALAAALAVSTPALADEWDLSEDGKYWMYFDYSGEPLQDEWIEVEGKIY